MTGTNMNSNVLRYGYRYELNDDWKQYYDMELFAAEYSDRKNSDEVEVGYHYAIPVEYADGCVIGDCWIVNAQGQVHPGFNISPVPHNISCLSNPVFLETA